MINRNFKNGVLKSIVFEVKWVVVKFGKDGEYENKYYRYSKENKVCEN